MPSSYLGITDEDHCYIPIFVSNAGQRVDAFDAWFLGNMFLNRYYVINDSEGSSKVLSPPRYPLVGIYDKVNPQVPKDSDVKPPPMPENLDPFKPKDGSKDKTGGSSTDTKTGDKTDADTDSGGMGAGWVILILLLIFGGLVISLDCDF